MTRLFMFVTPDGATCSSEDFLHPDVDNLQVLGFGSGHDEEEAFEDFVSKTKWLSSTKFRRVISIEVKHPIEQGKSFMLPDS